MLGNLSIICLSKNDRSLYYILCIMSANFLFFCLFLLCLSFVKMNWFVQISQLGIMIQLALAKFMFIWTVVYMSSDCILSV